VLLLDKPRIAEHLRYNLRVVQVLLVHPKSSENSGEVLLKARAMQIVCCCELVTARDICVEVGPGWQDLSKALLA